MPLLTQGLIDSLRPDENRDRIVFDKALTGFGVRVCRSGYKSYMIQYRSQNRTRRYTLGNCNVLTPLQARKKARSLLAGIILNGENPAEQRKGELKCLKNAKLLLVESKRLLKNHTKENRRRAGSVLRAVRHDV